MFQLALFTASHEKMTKILRDNCCSAKLCHFLVSDYLESLRRERRRIICSPRIPVTWKLKVIICFFLFFFKGVLELPDYKPHSSAVTDWVALGAAAKTTRRTHTSENLLASNLHSNARNQEVASGAANNELCVVLLFNTGGDNKPPGILFIFLLLDNNSTALCYIY